VRKARVIWIDTLSINQNDIPEKNQQVMLMGKIYSNCRKVVMWLGDGVGGNTVDTFTVEAAKPSTPGINTPERSQVYDAFVVIHLLATDSHFNHIPFFHRFEDSGATETSSITFQKDLEGPRIYHEAALLGPDLDCPGKHSSTLCHRGTRFDDHVVGLLFQGIQSSDEAFDHLLLF
jgi:hypothetical protein